MITAAISLILCIISYIIFWYFDYLVNNHNKGKYFLGSAYFFGSFGTILFLINISKYHNLPILFNNIYLLPFFIILFGFLFIYTVYIKKRRLTEELILMCGLLTLNLYLVNLFYGLNTASYIIISYLILSIITFIISYLCYSIFLSLNKIKGFICGIIPLLCMLFMFIFLLNIFIKI